jgi:hypothetical protein
MYTVNREENCVSDTNVLEHPIVRAIVTRAAGCKIELIPPDAISVVARQRCTPDLLVNGVRCTILNPRRMFTNKGAVRSYTKTMVSFSTLDSVDMVIIHTTIAGFDPNTFVIPSKVLLRAYFDPPRRRAMLWLPVEQLPRYRNLRPRINYWSYLDAWP